MWRASRNRPYFAIQGDTNTSQQSAAVADHGGHLKIAPNAKPVKSESPLTKKEPISSTCERSHSIDNAVALSACSPSVIAPIQRWSALARRPIAPGSEVHKLRTASRVAERIPLPSRAT